MWLPLDIRDKTEKTADIINRLTPTSIDPETAIEESGYENVDEIMARIESYLTNPIWNPLRYQQYLTLQQLELQIRQQALEVQQMEAAPKMRHQGYGKTRKESRAVPLPEPGATHTRKVTSRPVGKRKQRPPAPGGPGPRPSPKPLPKPPSGPTARPIGKRGSFKPKPTPIGKRNPPSDFKPKPKPIAGPRPRPSSSPLPRPVDPGQVIKPKPGGGGVGVRPKPSDFKPKPKGTPGSISGTRNKGQQGAAMGRHLGRRDPGVTQPPRANPREPFDGPAGQASGPGIRPGGRPSPLPGETKQRVKPMGRPSKLSY
jgi:hypothetical protein